MNNKKEVTQQSSTYLFGDNLSIFSNNLKYTIVLINVGFNVVNNSKY